MCIFVCGIHSLIKYDEQKFINEDGIKNNKDINKILFLFKISL